MSATGMVGGPLRFLSPDESRLFARGAGVFARLFEPGDGLGPLFNAEGCGACHEVPVLGGAGSNDPAEEGEDVELHGTEVHGATSCDNLSTVGGPVFQKEATEALQGIGIDHEEPPATAARANRTTPDVFGFGLLDAVPDAEILALADPNDRNGDGISGRPNRTADGRLGRFGRKAQVARLDEFNAEAFVQEMGITNPGFPVEQIPGGVPFPEGIDQTGEPEVPQEDLDAANGFVRFLAPPPPPRLDLVGLRGFMNFARIGCASCHVPALVTGPNPSRALRFRVVRAYTDLLLHDMGPELADICLAQAAPAEFRTEPLMGLRFATAFLHDGRAATIQQAITLHDGEARRARNRFLRLSPFDRAALLRFLHSL
jgi:CxxC motif-containing protein (DUF1111 family)